jgi:hypothetical protein
MLETKGTPNAQTPTAPVADVAANKNFLRLRSIFLLLFAMN